MFSRLYVPKTAPYSFTINGGIHKQDRYIEMRHGQQYSVTIRNDSSKRCQATLNIDGHHMGDFLVEAHNSITVDRPVHSNKCFTFYRTDRYDPSSFETGIIPGRYDNGLVEVDFIPEKTHVYKYTASFRNTNTYDYESSDALNASFCAPLSHRTTKYAEGGTALSGHSNQHFRTVAPLNLDYTGKVSLSYRLVGKEYHAYDDYVEPVYRSQTRPKPVYRDYYDEPWDWCGSGDCF